MGQKPEPIYPRAEDNEEIVDHTQPHSPIPAALVEIKTSDNHHSLEKRDHCHPVKMLKQELEEHVTLYASAVGINAGQSERPVCQLEENEKNKIEAILIEHLDRSKNNVPSSNDPTASQAHC